MATCCDKPTPVWASMRDGERWTDRCTCEHCNTVLKSETWFAPVIVPPGDNRCANCGGELVLKKPSVVPGKKGQQVVTRTPPNEPRCTGCGLSAPEAREVHDKLARLHPEGDHLAAAEAAVDAHRYVLALKLGTAALWYGLGDPDRARMVRIHALRGLALYDNALDEAYPWAETGGPSELWRLIAEIEVDGGSVEQAVKALRWCLELDPNDAELRGDVAELALAIGDVGLAMSTAVAGLDNEVAFAGCADIIVAVAANLMEGNDTTNANATLDALGERAEKHLPAAWLRAQIAAVEGDQDAAIQWLEIVLHLEPEHAEARAALERIQPKKSGWLW